ncbi:MAG TPA: NAD-dependent epimerase/dehydratase family protein [Candidatus Paceibacterota bacterium]|jgi:UDP-glucose 4-epimerase|nr:NAD-dependent epimerase/dehydratase family protein [Candidatus Paceibacterota bacterium]HOH11538.1 NAD-dependent epimerase/dehydratase family protein [Candidatus Paceibacterota bacterium]HPB60299.1 NAD-dependent epimerase/dehydratase family protein [Candidatus Paceibacterota bacterium]HPV33468.1 NAD-dependent epimerase/dehydratase family protein [Candidatus Paceibacterota bacterium]HPY13199.1 NAD-dependent epimerase/dehydratase family protein [Candidatus Paceibacterota bacterium]
MSKIIVTGGAGFIGSNLVDELVARGDEVHIIDNLSGGKQENLNPAAIFHKEDITNFSVIRPLFDEVEYVFHLAALPLVQYSIEHPIETNEANVGGTLNVLTAAKEAGVKKVVYSASSAAYGDQAVMPLVEEMPAKPKSPYGLQKYIGEMYCRIFSEIYNLPTVCLRYFNVYGPRQNEEGAYALVIGKFLKQKREGLPLTITGDGTQTRDFVSVHDVARANILAMEKEVGGGEVFNIGAGQNYSVNEVAKMIGGEVEYIPARLEPYVSQADNRKAREVLGWTPTVSLAEGLKELTS